MEINWHTPVKWVLPTANLGHRELFGAKVMVGDRVLVPSSDRTDENGIYTVFKLAEGGGLALCRAPDSMPTSTSAVMLQRDTRSQSYYYHKDTRRWLTSLSDSEGKKESRDTGGVVSMPGAD